MRPGVDCGATPAQERAHPQRYTGQVKIALAQINPTVGDFAGNTRRILDFTQRAADLGADVVLFPELSICGYPPADLLEKSSFVARAEQALQEIAASTAAGGPAILCGTALPATNPEGKHARNVAALLDKGKVAFLQQKMLLPFYDVFDEQRYFEPATRQTLTTIDGQPLAITICEDAWNDKGFWPRRFHPVDPVDQLLQQWRVLPDPLGRCPRILLNISASPYWKGKRAVRQEMLSAIARQHHAYVLMCNQVGGNDSLIFDGSSLAIAPDGSLIARGASFEEDLLLIDTSAATQPRRDVSDDADDIAATWSALVLGTRDYVRKCGFSKALVGLSGGIDSALVAAIAVEALGAENVLGVGMPSEFSSTGSIDDARDLATNLGIRFDLVAIRDVFTAYGKALEPLFAGTPFGLAEENLQSRIRGALLMALSNKFGALVLTTGNKSEMSTGYCTLYGDMVGALAVIGDVYKTRVYKLAHHANRDREIIPHNTIEKPPSAELRPGQKDTDSLPAYDVLDPILEAYVERFCSAEEIVAEMGGVPAGVVPPAPDRPAAPAADLELVKRVLKLVERAEYKRQQAAPVLKVTQKSFGTGRRFPIAIKVEI
jgi:NAD+ synthase (glutamine-hydrolysing)